MLLPVFLLFLPALAVTQSHECDKRWFDQDSFVCVCTSTKCDEPEKLGEVGQSTAVIYSTSRASDRLKRTEQPFQNNTPANAIQLLVDSKVRYQRILGFGGAVTDAVASIWSNPRCDFSLSEYSYLEKDQDFELDSISFVNDETKIKLLKQIISITNQTGQPRFFASPWSAPGWMKQNGRMKGGARLRGDFNGIYYLTYARYLQQFFVHYYTEGIKFFAMTIQNEPFSGLNPNYSFQTMDMNSQMQRDFAQVRLRPIFKMHPATENLKIFGHDDNRDRALEAAKTMFAGNNTAIDGVAVHWYSDRDDHAALTSIHNQFSDRMILATEASNADRANEHIPLLGSWYYAERYSHDIIQNLRNWAVGWTDWNLFLNMFGGPNWSVCCKMKNKTCLVILKLFFLLPYFLKNQI